MEGINTRVQVFREDKDLDPKQQTSCEELVNQFLHLLDMRTVARNLREVFRPESARVLQCVSNVNFLTSRQVFDVLEDRRWLQETNVLF